MTLDGMILYIEDHNHDDDVTKAIIAALRAGQKMRDQLHITDDGTTAGGYARPRNNCEMFRLAKEWDRAVEGEKKWQPIGDGQPPD